MAWLEVSIQVVPEIAEAVAEVLSRYAPQGVAIDLGDSQPAEQVTVKAYLEDAPDLEEKRQKISEGLWHLSHIMPMPEPTFTPIADQDWTAGWKEKIQVLHIGQRVVIKPSWRAYSPQKDEIVLEMDPGLAFGTGLHPTTQLCLLAMENVITPGMRVLDVGTGTGILSLVAARLGASEILAVDTDANAVTASRRNARANDVASQIQVVHGSLEKVTDAYDLVLANILAPIIIKMAGANLNAVLKPGGILVASGVLEDQKDEVSQALLNAGIKVETVEQQEDWVVLLARKMG